MKIIINGFHDLAQITMLKELCSEEKIEKIAIISQVKYQSYFKDFPVNIDVFFWENVYLENKLPILNSYESTPLDADLLKDFTTVELEIYTMLHRHEMHGFIGYEKRKTIYRQQLYFWFNYINQNNFDIYLSSNIPHEICDYLIYHVMKKANKKILMFYQTQVYNTIFPTDNVQFNNFIMEEDYKKLLSEEFNINQFNDIKITPNISKELERRLVPEIETPFYMVKKLPVRHEALHKRKITFNRVIRHLKYRINGFEVRSIHRLLRSSQTKKYSQLSGDVNYTKRYIYFPLHYQPECTTCPMGGTYMDQALIVSMLSSCCKDELYIYIKEHPKQGAIQRSPQFYEELAAYKNVRLIPVNTSSEILIKNAIAVVTVSGTAGWEALFNRKPVLLFGANFYQYFPYVYKVNSFRDLQVAYQQILHLKQFDLDRVIAGLKLLTQYTINGIIDPIYNLEGGITAQESCLILKRYIKRVLEQ